MNERKPARLIDGAFRATAAAQTLQLANVIRRQVDAKFFAGYSNGGRTGGKNKRYTTRAEAASRRAMQKRSRKSNRGK